MKVKHILAGMLAVITAIGLIGCGKVDESSNDSKDAKAAAAESSSFVESEIATEESSEAVESNTEAESSWAEESSQQESIPDEDETLSVADEEKPINEVTYTADEIAFFEQFTEKVYAGEYDTATEYLMSVFGDDAKLTELGEFMNAFEKIYLKNRFDYADGVSVLGEKFYSVTVDYDYNDKTVYTVGFNKNPDLNSSVDGDPSSSECKDSYDKLYTQLQEKYGEPSGKFTREQNGYIGAIWTDTPCGEIWIAWGEEIFGSTQADCIISFSTEGISGLS